jgi:hypothetical protein
VLEERTGVKKAAFFFSFPFGSFVCLFVSWFLFWSGIPIGSIVAYQRRESVEQLTTICGSHQVIAKISRIYLKASTL